MPETVKLNLFYDPQAPVVVNGAVSFETGATPRQAMDPKLYAYEHHGDGFGMAGPSALTCLFEDMVLGRPLPPSFLVNRVGDIDTLLAATLFLHRELLLCPATVGLVAQFDLVHRRGYPMLGHIDSDVGRFIRLLRAYFPDELSRVDVNTRLPQAVSWIRDYLVRGTLPALGQPFPNPKVLDTAPYGFVVAETTGSLPEGWFTLYGHGYTHGVVFGARQGTLLPVLVARKSRFVPFRLEEAAFLFNEQEVVLGGRKGWVVSGDWLWGPPEGSLILAKSITEGLLRLEVPLVALT